MLAQGAAGPGAGEPRSHEEQAWVDGAHRCACLDASALLSRASFSCEDVAERLRGALAPSFDDAALQQAATLVLSSVLDARPASLRRSGTKLPANACVTHAGALAAYAARGLGACGDLQRAWTAARSSAPSPLAQTLLPVQPWLVAGVLRCGSDGLRLESADGRSIQVVARDALAAMPLVDRAVLAQRWALPPSSGLPPVLEVHSFTQLDTETAAGRRTPPLGESCVAGVVVAVSPLIRVQAQSFCIAVRFLCAARKRFCDTDIRFSRSYATAGTAGSTTCILETTLCIGVRR